MEELFNLMLNADEYIGEIVAQYGNWTYVILFAIIFIETGFVVTTFFPGDGLLFSAGILAASGELGLTELLSLLSIATVLGHTSNYWIGRFFGKRFFKKEKLKPTHYLFKAYNYYEQHGTLAVILSRFIPFMRSFVPFVSGIAKMDFRRYTWANILGGIGWIAAYLLLGYFFGGIHWVKDNYGLVFSVMILLLLLLLFLSMIKSVYQLMKGSKQK